MITSRIMITRLILILFLGVRISAATIDTGHPFRGEVIRVLPEKQLVIIKHEAIPGFMRAMTMAFSVPAEAWPQMTPGTHLTATLHGGRGEWQLADIQLTDEDYQLLPTESKTMGGGYPLTLTPISSPAGPHAMGSSLTRSTDGTLYLSWMEEDSDELTSLHFSKFDPASQRWSESQLIASGPDWFVNWADFPALAVETDGKLTAIWFVRNIFPSHHNEPSTHHGAGYQAWFSQSTDEGASWSAPSRLTTESTAVEFVSLQPLARGGLLAVWLDGRGKRAGGNAMQLYGRIIGSDGPDQLIDDSVCDCCQTTLTTFPNGSALVAYRARREGEIRDIHTALFSDGEWSPPRILSADEWQINGCPVNGPQLDSVGGRVAAVWFTGADNVSRVYASGSPDAGARFTMPQRIDLGNPLGRVDTVLLRDGSQLVTWLESSGDQEAGIYLRRIAANDELGPAVLLASTSRERASGFPRIALLKDYDTTPGQIMVSFTRDQESSTLETLLVTLPDLSTLAGRKPCLPCDEDDANATRGYPIKGVVTRVMADRGMVVVKHQEIPGVMRAMTMAFHVQPDTLAKLTANQALLGRIERRGRDWHLFSVKLLGAPTS